MSKEIAGYRNSPETIVHDFKDLPSLDPERFNIHLHYHPVPTQVTIYEKRHGEGRHNLELRNDENNLPHELLGIADRDIPLSKKGRLQSEEAVCNLAEKEEIYTLPTENIIAITATTNRAETTGRIALREINEIRREIGEKEITMSWKTSLLNEVNLGLLKPLYWLGYKDVLRPLHEEYVRRKHEDPQSLLYTPIIDPNDERVKKNQQRINEIAKELGLETDTDIYGETWLEKEKHIRQFKSDLFYYLDYLAEEKKGEKILVLIFTHQGPMSMWHLISEGTGKSIEDLSKEELNALMNPKGAMKLNNCAIRVRTYDPEKHSATFQKHMLNSDEGVAYREKIAALENEVRTAFINRETDNLDLTTSRWESVIKEGEENASFVERMKEKSENVLFRNNTETKTNEVFIEDVKFFRPLVEMALKHISRGENYYREDQIVNIFEEYIKNHSNIPHSDVDYILQFGVRFNQWGNSDVKGVMPIVKVTGLIPLSVFAQTMITASTSPPLIVNSRDFSLRLLEIVKDRNSSVSDMLITDETQRKYPSVRRHAYYINRFFENIKELDVVTGRDGHTIFSSILPENELVINKDLYEKDKETIRRLKSAEKNSASSSLPVKVSNMLSFSGKDKQREALNTHHIIIRCDDYLQDTMDKNKKAFDLILQHNLPLEVPKTVLIFPGDDPEFIPNMTVMDFLAESTMDYLKRHPEKRREFYRQLGVLGKMFHAIQEPGFGNYYDKNEKKFSSNSPAEYYNDRFIAFNDYLSFNSMKNTSVYLNQRERKEVSWYFSDIFQKHGEDSNTKDFRLIHGDLVLKNSLVIDDEIRALVDFDHMASVENPLAWELDRIILGLASDDEREDFYEGFCAQGYGLNLQDVTTVFPESLLHHIRNIFDSYVYRVKTNKSLMYAKLEEDLIRSTALYNKIIPAEDFRSKELMKKIDSFAAISQQKNFYGTHPFEEMAKFLKMKEKR